MTDHYDSIDQWLDWGDHTVTIDPMHNSAWIHEGQEGKHKDTVKRGREYDAMNVKHMMELLNGEHRPTISLFVPTWGDLQCVPRFPSKRSGDCDHWKGQLRDIRGAGNLPVIAQKLYNGELRDVSKGVIEKESFLSQHAIAAKVLSRAGVPDHGLPSSGRC